MTANRLANLTRGIGELAGAQREVELLNFSSCKLAAQSLVREVVLSHHKTSWFVCRADERFPGEGHPRRRSSFQNDTTAR